jgi:hypothetical protein
MSTVVPSFIWVTRDGATICFPKKENILFQSPV